MRSTRHNGGTAAAGVISLSLSSFFTQAAPAQQPEKSPLEALVAPAGGPACRDAHASVDTHALESLVKNYLAPQGFTGAIALRMDGRTIGSVAIGTKGDGSPADMDTLYDCGSLTKQFTACAILKLKESGKLALSDTIAKYFPEAQEPIRSATIDQLLTHTSGLPKDAIDKVAPEVNRSERDVMCTAILKAPTIAKPGAQFEYCNGAYVVLAAIIEKSSGQGYREYLRAALFEPSGMHGVGFCGEKELSPRCAVGNSANGRAINSAERSYRWGSIGCTGVLISGEDFLRWDAALRTDTVLGAESKALLWQAESSDYSRGWVVNKDNKARVYQEHTGLTQGFSSEVVRFKDQDSCVIVLGSYERAKFSTTLRHLFRSVTSGDSVLPSVATNGPGNALGPDLCGRYMLDSTNSIMVTCEGSAITLHPSGRIACELLLDRAAIPASAREVDELLTSSIEACNREKSFAPLEALMLRADLKSQLQKIGGDNPGEVNLSARIVNLVPGQFNGESNQKGTLEITNGAHSEQFFFFAQKRSDGWKFAALQPAAEHFAGGADRSQEFASRNCVLAQSAAPSEHPLVILDWLGGTIRTVKIESGAGEPTLILGERAKAVRHAQ